jgi:tight adherence protein C
MPAVVIAAAAAVALSVPLLWWALAGPRSPRRAIAENLAGGLATADLRDLTLSRSAHDRAVRPFVGALADRGRKLTPASMLTSLERKITLAGRPPAWPMERVLAAKLLLGVAALLASGLRFAGEPGLRVLLAGAAMIAFGFFLPDLVLNIRAKNRQAEIQLKLPDTLDQITICVEAGLGFEAAMARAARNGSGSLADELIRTLQEMQVGASRAQALRNLEQRTNVAELRRFVLALLQAESLGMAIADVLRLQAAELRMKRRQRAEERAMKIPVKIIFPLVVCILPTLFIVILGPAGIRLARFFATGSIE